MRRRPFGGFTFIEIMVVLLLGSILSVPIWLIFQSGTKNALKGMLSIETTLEARKVIHSIHNDLKNACCELRDHEPEFDFSRMYTMGGTAIEPQFSFACFPFHSEIDGEVVPTTPDNERASRRVSRVKYWLEGSRKPGRPFSTLKRLEVFPTGSPLASHFPAGRETVLSERVNYFEIRPFQVNWNKKDEFFFWVHLRLIDTVQSDGKELPPVEAAQLVERSRGVILADFFDIASPDFFKNIWNNRGVRRNWYNNVVTPRVADQ